MPKGYIEISGVGSAVTSSLVRFVSQFTGADYGEQVNNAIADLPTGGEVVMDFIGQNDFTTQIVVPTGIWLHGYGQEATKLRWTGSGTGTAIRVLDSSNSRLSDFMVLTELVANTATCLEIAGGVDTVLERLDLGRGFYRAVRITSVSTGPMVDPSFTVWLRTSRLVLYTGIGLQIDHATDTFLDSLNISAAQDTTAAIDILLDTGCGGLYANNLSVQYGLNGLKVQDTFGDGAAPIYGFWNALVVDTVTGGHGILFDSTLGANIVDQHFVNSWSAGSGLNASGTAITATANGIEIAGGAAIHFEGGCRSRSNALNGLRISSANVSRVTWIGGRLTGNNRTDDADGHGVYITAAAADCAIIGAQIGNVVDSLGNQRYGIKVAAVAALELRIQGNDLNGNETSPLSDGNTSRTHTIGNLPREVMNKVYGPVEFYSNSDTAPATAGAQRFPNNEALAWRNHTADGDVLGIHVDNLDSSLVLRGGAWKIKPDGTLFSGSAGEAFDIGTITSLGRPRFVIVKEAVILGTNPATAGAVRLANSASIAARNAANTGDVLLVFLNSSDELDLKGGAWKISAGGHLVGGTDNTFDVGESGARRPRIAYLATAVAVGNNPASVGGVRLPNNTAIVSRNAANSGDVLLLYLNASDELDIKGGAWKVDAGGHMVPGASNTFNLGSASASVGSGYFGTRVRLVYGTASKPTFTDANKDLVSQNIDLNASYVVDGGPKYYTRSDVDAGFVELTGGFGNTANGYQVAGTTVVEAQKAAVADASGGSTVDAEARTAINTLLARLRDHGLIAT